MRRARRLSRRALLLGAGAVGAGACNGMAPHTGFLGVMERFNLRVQSALFDAEQLSPTEPESALTPERDFPDYFISPMVPMPPPGWVLRVGGMVAHPRTFTLEELMRLPRTDLRIRHHCVEGWSAVASWHGVALRELARVVGADARAPCLEFRSFDSGYWSTWDAPSALHPQSILAYGMNGAPLLPGHGAPLRLYAGVKLGYKMVKYLTEVNWVPDTRGGYWEDQGYEWFAGV